DLLEEVFLDGEGDVDVDVLGLLELAGDLDHRLVFFLVVPAVPPHHDLPGLGPRHHGKADRSGERPCPGRRGRLEEIPAGLTHELDVPGVRRGFHRGPDGARPPMTLATTPVATGAATLVYRSPAGARNS